MKKFALFGLVLLFSLVFTSASLSDLVYHNGEWYSQGDYRDYKKFSDDTFYREYYGYDSYKRYENDHTYYKEKLRDYDYYKDFYEDYHDDWDERNYWARNYYHTREYRDYRDDRYDYYHGDRYFRNRGYDYDDYYDSHRRRYGHYDNRKYDRDREYRSHYKRVYDDKVIYLNGKKVVYRDHIDLYYDDYDYKITESRITGELYLQKCHVNPPRDSVLYFKC